MELHCHHVRKFPLKSFQRSWQIFNKASKNIALPVALYECETWSLTLWDEHSLEVFENENKVEVKVKLSLCLNKHHAMKTYLITYSLTHSLTHSMVQDILCKADSHSSCQTVACFLYGTLRFITVLTKARHRTIS
jgi:hypothetical protein